MAALNRIACLLACEPEDALSARRDLREVALAHSPRVEEGDPGLVYLDVAGLRGLFGDEEQIGRRLVRGAAERGRPARVGIAGSRVGALFACRLGGDVTVIPPGRDAAYLARAPLALLDLSPEMAARLDRWGLLTLGDLATLPSAQLFERLGSEGLDLQRLARGDDPRPLRPWEPPLVFEESAQLDGAGETLPPLVELMARLADRISDRLVRGGLSADQIEWICHLADRICHEGRITPAFPVTEGRAMAALVKAALEARPARSPVEAVTLRARPVRVPVAQASIEDPLRPSPRLIAATLARVAALVGAGQVGAPRLIDSHRPDSVTLDHGAWPGQQPSRPRPAPVSAARAVLALRRIRPPVPATVTLAAGRPVEIRSRGLAARIIASAGPWRVSGEWWTERPWFRDEWDVELAPSAPGQPALICRLVHDGSAWWLEGIYD